MKAIIRRGKQKGLEVEIHQWCNDWFTVTHPDIHPQDSVKSPSSLLFTMQGLNEIKGNENNGILFNLYEPCLVEGIEQYIVSFKRIKR